MRMKKYKIASDMSIHVVFPIVLGSLIYVCFRALSLEVFSWVRAVGMHAEVLRLRLFVSPIKALLPEWVLFSLPDSLWVYSVTAFMCIVWHGSKENIRYFWILVGALLAIGGECGQLTGYVPGTFDILDLGMCCVAPLVVCWVMSKKNIQREEFDNGL